METTPGLSPGGLAGQWRQRAEYLDDFGDPNTARLWAMAAAELDEALKTLGEETLTLVEAAAVSGYTSDHLGSLVRQGKIPNVGRPNAPRVRRADVPTKSPAAPGRPAAAATPRRRRKGAGADVTDIAKLQRKPKPGTD